MLRNILVLLLMLTPWTTAGAQHYTLPYVPDTLRSVAGRADYAVSHFWERFDFSDSTLLRADYGEQALADYLALMEHASPQARRQSVADWWQRMSASTLSEEYFYDLARHYLHDAASPLRNDSLYLLVTECAALATDVAVGSRAMLHHRLLTSNAVGTVAANIDLLMADGTASHLSDLTGEGELLVVFFDPDCRDCRSLLFTLRHSSLLRQRMTDAGLRVLTVCVESDRQAWHDVLVDQPATWQHAMAADRLQLDNRYDLSIIPCMYLLDAAGRVVCRDVRLEDLWRREKK